MAARRNKASLEVSAETAYLFRHALLRDAAYQLQMPRERARLHALALEVMEEALGTAIDRFPAEAAYQAHNALQGDLPLKRRKTIQARELHYLQLWMQRAKANDEHTALRQSLDRIEHSPVAPPAAVANAIRERGILYWRLGRYAEAEAEFRRALPLARKHDAALACQIISNISVVSTETGNVDAALELVKESLAASALLPERTTEALVRTNFGNLLWALGRLPEALAEYRKSESQYRAAGELRRGAIVKTNIALALHYTGNRQQAEQLYLECLGELPEETARGEVSNLLGNYATLLQETGRHTEAEKRFHQALELCRVSGNRAGEAVVIGNYGNLLVEMKRLADAERAYTQSISISREIRAPQHEGSTLSSLGQLYFLQDRMEDAEDCERQALKITRQIKDRRFETTTLWRLVHIFLRRGRIAAGKAAAAKAIANLRAQSDYERLPLALYDLACVDLLVGQTAEARAALAELRTPVGSPDAGAAYGLCAAMLALRIAPTDSSAACIHELVDEIDTRAKAPDALAHLDASVLEAAAKLGSEWLAALKSATEPCLFRGHRPAELSSELRRSLLVFMAESQRAELKSLQSHSPRIFAALEHDTQTGALASWAHPDPEV